jgi:hypothetical protein
MRAGRLLEAQRDLLVCARDPCPAALQPECAGWLADVQRSLPSLVIGAKSSRGEDLQDVRVLVDGRLASTRLDGTAIDVDPGDHLVRLEAPGESPVEQRVLVHEGEKARVLELRFAATSPSASTPSSAPVAASPAPRQQGESATPSRVPAYVLGGVGVVATAAFAYFGLSGLSLWNECHQGCPSSHVDEGNRDWLGADVSLGVAVVALAAATYLYVRAGSTSSAPTVGIGAGPGVAAAWLRASF